MGDVKTLVQEIFSWLNLQEESTKKLKNLANEIEKRQKTINVTKVVGSSVSVSGAAVLAVAGITVLTGGLAIPFMGAAATVASVAGLATNVTSDLVGAYKSNDALKEAEEITEKMEKLKKKIHELVKTLREKWLKKGKQEPGTSPEDYVIREIVKEIARLNGFQMDDNLYKKMSGKKPGDNLLERLDLPVLSNFMLTIAVEITDEELKDAKKAAAGLVIENIIEKGAEKVTARYVMKEAAKVATTAAVAKTAAEEAAKAATKAGLEGSVKVITAKFTGGEAAKRIIAKATAEEAAKVVAARAAAKQAAEQAAKAAAAKAAAKATAKAAGRALGGVFGLVFSVPELISNYNDLDKCDTNVSKMLRENANAIQTTAEQMREELDDMQKLFKVALKTKTAKMKPSCTVL